MPHDAASMALWSKCAWMKKAQESILILQPCRYGRLMWSSNLVCAVCPASIIYCRHLHFSWIAEKCRADYWIIWINLWRDKATSDQAEAYHSVVGKIMYLVIKLFPKRANAARDLIHHFSNPGEEHCKALGHYVGYLKENHNKIKIPTGNHWNYALEVTLTQTVHLIKRTTRVLEELFTHWEERLWIGCARPYPLLLYLLQSLSIYIEHGIDRAYILTDVDGRNGHWRTTWICARR